MADIPHYKSSTMVSSKTSVQRFYKEYKWMINALILLIACKILVSSHQISLLSYNLQRSFQFIKGLLLHRQLDSDNRIFDDLRFEYDMDINKLPMILAGIGLLVFVILLS